MNYAVFQRWHSHSQLGLEALAAVALRLEAAGRYCSTETLLG
jgi:hypothetical protein